MFLRAPWIFFLYKWTPFFLSLYFCHSEKKLVIPYLFGDFFLFFIYFCLFSFEWRIIHAKKKTKYKKASTVWMNPGTEKEVIMYKCKRYGQREDETWKWQGRSYFSEGFANRAARVRTCFCWQSVFGFFTITLKHIQDLRESSVGRLLSLNSWCGIKSYTISFLSLTQEASQAKTSYVH